MPERTIDTIATPTGDDLQASSISDSAPDHVSQPKVPNTLRASYPRAGTGAD